ncbi:MAG: tetratricopeptide repeat protein [Melioribacteraceae bacterium]|nr:tetratricopeptide repeat protein [Melioribacteraceae bacterium]
MNNKSNKNPIWFYFVAILVSFSFIVLIEVGLRIFNYGNDYSLWIEKGNYLKLNPLIAKKYFKNTEAIPYPIPDLFEKIKSQNTIRIFVIGESSAAGFPYSPNGTFSKYIRLKLEDEFPANNIEVINLSMAAINSYTFLDFVKSLIEFEPDAILIYGGHNEYYGALGVGSSEFLSSSVSLNRFLLKLQDYKLFQLVENFILYLSKAIDKKDNSGTLMQRMVQEKYIPYESEIFFEGVKQFENNLNELLFITSKNNIPVIIGNLVSNIKDQKPFLSKKFETAFDANTFFNLAIKEEENKNFHKADSFYRLAKDYDLLKFRAPEKINKVINSFSKKYFVQNINIDSLFKNYSPNGLIGNNLMTDHLHPTLEGYKLIGELFYKELKKIFNTKKSFIPKKESPVIDYSFTQLDSTIADFRIKVLKNSWPYKLEETNTKNAFSKIGLNTIVDTLAINVLKENISWVDAHSKLADFYFINKNYKAYFREMEVIIDQLPKENIIYESVATKLIEVRKYDLAEKILLKQNRQEETFFSNKWLGNISLQNKNYEMAVKYLENSLQFRNNDAQVLYNLAGCYLMLNQIEKAKDKLITCLKINPDYQQAKLLLEEIKSFN